MISVIPVYLQSAYVLAPLVAIIAIGVFWGKRDYPFAGQFVTVLVTTVTTPALVFKTLVTTEMASETLFEIVGSAVLGLLLCATLGASLLKLVKMPVRPMLQLVSFPNAGNLGLPISALAFGEVGLSTAIAFFAVTSFLTHTVGVRSLPNTRGVVGGWKCPILIASLAAVAMRLTGLPVPAWLLETAGMLGVVTVPLMLLRLGHALALIPATSLRTGALMGVIRLGGRRGGRFRRDRHAADGSRRRGYAGVAAFHAVRRGQLHVCAAFYRHARCRGGRRAGFHRPVPGVCAGADVVGQLARAS